MNLRVGTVTADFPNTDMNKLTNKRGITEQSLMNYLLAFMTQELSRAGESDKRKYLRALAGLDEATLATIAAPYMPVEPPVEKPA
jgi:hypothetical protein